MDTPKEPEQIIDQILDDKTRSNVRDYILNELKIANPKNTLVNKEKPPARLILDNRSMIRSLPLTPDQKDALEYSLGFTTSAGAVGQYPETDNLGI